MNGGEFEDREGFGSPTKAMDAYGQRSRRGNSPLYKQHVNSLEPSPIREINQYPESKGKSPLTKSQMDSSQPRRETQQYSESRRVVESVRARVETELTHARKTVCDLALKIEEVNSRAKQMEQQKLRWLEQEPETSLKNEDTRYEQVMKELEHIQQELNKLKLDMAQVLKEKKHAEREYKASSSKMFTLSSSFEIIKKEIQELNEEQVFVELARIEAVKERKAIEAQRKEQARHYETQLEEVKTKIKEIVQHYEMTRALERTLYDVNSLEGNLALAKETDKRIESNESYSPALLTTITEELEVAKLELAAIKREGFDFMASMDVIRDELKRIREETARREKAEEKQDLTVRHLNSKITREKDKLEAVTAAAERANMIASNLSLTLEQLRAEAKTAKREEEIIREELENIKAEILKTESEIELAEERLEAAIEELKAVKSSELKALDNLKDLIDTTVRARDLASLNSSTITISNFEYEYLMGRASEAEEVADKKVAAAQAWVEALKVNEKEILMKIEMAQREIQELSVYIEEEEEEEQEEREAYKADHSVRRRRSIDGELMRRSQNGAKVFRKSAYRIGNMVPGKRARSQNLRSPATRRETSSASFTVKRETVVPNLGKLSNKNTEMDEQTKFS